MDVFSFGFGSSFCFLSLMCGISLLSGFLLFDRLAIPIRCHFFPTGVLYYLSVSSSYVKLQGLRGK